MPLVNLNGENMGTISLFFSFFFFLSLSLSFSLSLPHLSLLWSAGLRLRALPNKPIIIISRLCFSSFLTLSGDINISAHLNWGGAT